MTYQAIFERADDGSIWVHIPDLPGATSWGATVEEARRNAVEAATLWIETTRANGGEIPAPSTIAYPIDVPAA